MNRSEVLQVVKGNLKMMINAKHSIIESETLPVVRSNQVLMIQLFQNLLANAIKYNNSDQPHVRISYIQEKEFYRFCVTDNGIGIEEKYREKVFEIFTRLQNRQHHSGSGIGLAICKKIVDRFGGDIHNQPNEAGGTDFIFTLPVE